MFAFAATDEPCYASRRLAVRGGPRRAHLVTGRRASGTASVVRRQSGLRESGNPTHCLWPAPTTHGPSLWRPPEPLGFNFSLGVAVIWNWIGAWLSFNALVPAVLYVMVERMKERGRK